MHLELFPFENILGWNGLKIGFGAGLGLLSFETRTILFLCFPIVISGLFQIVFILILSEIL